MKVLYLSTRWGAEHLPLEEFLEKSITSGFDGIESWLPSPSRTKGLLLRLAEEYKLPIVCQQHQATGKNIKAYCKSLIYHLAKANELNPIFINSHSGRDYFTLDDQLRVIDTAEEFSDLNKVKILHETHRGRLGYSPYNAKELFRLRKKYRITADFSHWVCLSESYLEHSPKIIQQAVQRTDHIHARIGFPQGPQVSDPRFTVWKTAREVFFEWWLQIYKYKKEGGSELLTVTPEFGPPPYMSFEKDNAMLHDTQFEINCHVKNTLQQMVQAYESS